MLISGARALITFSRWPLFPPHPSLPNCSSEERDKKSVHETAPRANKLDQRDSRLSRATQTDDWNARATPPPTPPPPPPPTPDPGFTFPNSNLRSRVDSGSEPAKFIYEPKRARSSPHTRTSELPTRQHGQSIIAGFFAPGMLRFRRAFSSPIYQISFYFSAPFFYRQTA